MKKWIVVIGLVLIVVISYNYIYQEHRNISSETPEFVVTADEIKKAFEHSSESEKKYLNKTIAVTGQVSDANITEVTLESIVFCQLIDSLKTTLKKNSNIKIKGRVIGYDDLLEQVKMDQCMIIKH
ncbi:MAG TPA: hypothetical protein VKZ98_06060 [Aquaticitalea sp.]|nr:hypothetical protein [Aquaticitalea sp.]